MHDEVARRDQRKLAQRLRRANFRSQKTLEGFDFVRLPTLNRALVHDLVAERYERAATILTSNLDLGEWGDAFPANKMLGAATLDRIRHGAYRVVLEGDSFRNPKPIGEGQKNSVEKGGKSAHA